MGALRYAFRKGRRAALRGGVAGAAWEAMLAVVPLFAQKAIDQGLITRDWPRLALWLTLLVVSGVLTAVFSGMRHRSATQAGAVSTYGLRGYLVRHLLGLNIGFHDRSDRGDLLVRVTTDTDAVGNFMDAVVTWIAHTAGIMIIIVLMLRMDLELGLIGIAYIPLVLLLMGIVLKAYEGQTVFLREAAGRLTSILHSFIFGVRVIKGFGLESNLRKQFAPVSDVVVNRAMALAMLSTATTVWGTALPGLALVAVLWRGGVRAIAGDISVGVLVAFGAWMVRLTTRTSRFMVRTLNFLQARVSVRRINSLLSVTSGIGEPEKSAMLPATGGLLHFSDVSVSIGERRLLDGVSLELAPVKAVVLVGKSGSGKSLLLSLAPRLYDPQTGCVYLDGIDIRDLSLEELRTAVCLASDDTFLFRDTVGANIALGSPGAPRSDIEEAARLAQAHNFIAELPQNYDTVVGERGLTLSGGQRQRIALARALLVGSRVLLLDDISSSLDPATDAAVWGGLTKSGSRRSLLIATQRRSIARLADLVVLLDSGRLKATGTDAELWKTAGLYREVLGDNRVP